MTDQHEMAKVAVVGAGNIGSRHLQALVKFDRPLEIYVVDPSPDALGHAAARVDEVASNEHVSVHYVGEFSKLPSALDVAIVATTSKERRGAIEAMLEGSTARFLILEKVLFPAPSDYEAVGALLSANGVVAYVNCVHRLYPFYQRMRNEIGGAGPVDLQVSGSGWGLATNYIHFLDLTAFLCGRTDARVDHVNIDEVESDPRHVGRIDFFGDVQGGFGDGSTISVRSSRAGDAPLTVTLRTADRLCVVNERLHRAWVYDNDSSWVPSEAEAPMPRQSELTHHLVASLIDTGECGLPSYEDSSAIHLAMLVPFLQAIRAHRDSPRQFWIT